MTSGCVSQSFAMIVFSCMGWVLIYSLCVSHSVMSYSATTWAVSCPRLLYPWNSPGKNTGVGCHFLLQGILLIQGQNPGLLHCRQILYLLIHLGIFSLNHYLLGYLILHMCVCVCVPMHIHISLGTVCSSVFIQKHWFNLSPMNQFLPPNSWLWYTNSRMSWAKIVKVK